MLRVLIVIEIDSGFVSESIVRSPVALLRST